jgi:glycerol-3-phosphate dehydrogenase (NAD(P)+)
MKIAVIGAGGWGTALSIILDHNSHDVTLWCFEKVSVDEIVAFHENKQYLPGVTIPLNIKITADIKEAVESNSIIILSVPVQFLSSVLNKIKDCDYQNKLFCNTAKGLEISSSRLPHQIIRSSLKHLKNDSIITLSGPSHAEESARMKPTNIISASSSLKSANTIKKAFSNSFFNVERSKDITGVELGAALKNVIAIGVGVCDGLNYGDNTKAGLLIKGLNDISALGMKMGAKKETFYGLSGLGDLMVTCYSRHSRNRYVGEQIGTGKSLKEITGSMKMVAEGVATTKAAYTLMEKYKSDSILIRELYGILFERRKPETAIANILNS